MTELTKEEFAYLNLLYYDVKKTGSLRGPLPLYRLVKNEGKMKISMKKIQSFLKSQPVYTRFKHVGEVGVLRQPRNKIEALYVGHIFQFDLMTIDPEYGKKERTLREIQNAEKSYVLVGVDTFSRFLFAVNLTGRDSDSLIAGLKLIFDSHKYKPALCLADPAGEHRSRKTVRFFKSRGIKLYYANSLKHAPSAERCIRFLRMGLRRYFAANNTSDHLTPLNYLVKSYNESICRVTKERPVDVFTSKAHAWSAYCYLYLRQKTGQKKKPREPSKNLPKIGDYVRISRIRGVFEKESAARGTFSQEIFKVTRVSTHMERPMVHIQDLNGSDVKGGFYLDEIQVVTYSPDQLFEVEKIVHRKKINKIPHVKVKWSGYRKLSGWIPETSLSEIEENSLIPSLH